MESLTAKLCAFARAWHSLQSDHTVFNDFLAFDLMGREEYENVSRLILKRFPQESENSVEYFNRKYFLPIVLSRSRFAEDRVKLLARSGKIQYVICGAGVDTFSFRNKDPNVEVFELDLYYLPLPVFAETVRQFSEIASTGISIVFDYLQKDAYSNSVQELRKIVADCGETMAEGYLDREVFEVLERYGFKVDEFLGENALQQRYFLMGNLKAFDSVRLIAAVK